MLFVIIYFIIIMLEAHDDLKADMFLMFLLFGIGLEQH